jgi:hypothetical protein
MNVRNGRPARGRRGLLMASIAAAGALAMSVPARAQDPQPAPPAQPPATPTQPAQPAQPAPAAPQPPANPFVFGSEAAMMTFIIKADKVADFEKVMAKLHQALANSDKPERRQQAANWKLYKAGEPGPNGNVIYFNVLAPVLKGADYAPSKIIAVVFPTEAQELFLLYRDAFAGLLRNELTLIQDFSTPQPKPAP